MRYAILLFALLFSLTAQEENRSAADYDVAADVQYCTGGGKPILMGVFIKATPRIHTPLS